MTQWEIIIFQMFSIVLDCSRPSFFPIFLENTNFLISHDFLKLAKRKMQQVPPAACQQGKALPRLAPAILFSCVLALCAKRRLAGDRRGGFTSPLVERRTSIHRMPLPSLSKTNKCTPDGGRRTQFSKAVLS